MMDKRHKILFGAEQTIIDNNETERNELYVTNTFAPSLNYETDNVTPRAGLLYLPTSNSSIYASYSESFELNALVGQQYDNAGEELDPTVGEMIELGYKWDSLDGDLIFSSAIFQIDRDNAPIETPGGLSIEQTGLQRHSGAEIALVGLIGNLTITSSMTYLDAEFTRDDNSDLVGNTPVSGPEISASLWTEYQLDDINGLSLQAGLFYESERQVDNENSFELDGYMRFDAGVKYAYRFADGNELTTRLTASNLFNEDYLKGANVFSLNREGDRQLRLSAEYSF